MENYLTERARRRRPWDVPLLIVCAVFVVGFIATMDRSALDNLAVSVIAYVILIGPFAAGIFLILRRRGRRVEKLIETGWLQNILVDRSADSAYLQVLAVKAPAPPRMLDVRCAGCGAVNRVIPGREARCEYCNSLLPLKDQ